MKHYGDVSKINGAEVEPVDIITFGAPCQDLSVAGKRSGMKHVALGDDETTRSGLFFEAIRIIKEMREATNGTHPRFAIYENVSGAFSSNKGHDFHAVLEALCSVCDDTVSIPEPYDKKRTKLVWNKAGEIVGDNYSIAWRTLDAQYWRVPQRRKRIYLVADFGGRCAGEILFEQESLPRNMQTGNEAGQGATADAVGSVDGSVGVECVGFDMYNQSSTGDKTRTLKTPAGGDDLPVVCVLNDQGGSSINVESEEISPTLRANSHQHEPVISFEPGAMVRDMGNRIWEEQSPTLRANMGDNQTAVCFENHQHGGYREGCGTLRASGGDYGGGSENVVCYDARGNGDGETVLFEPRSPDGEPRIYDDICPTLNTAQGGQRQPCIVENSNPPRKYIIRRLTPTECARLQGFQDDWGHLAPYDPADAEFWEDVRKTHAEINGKTYKPVKDIKKWYDKLHNDGAEYKAYGNGLALPCAEFVIRGIAEVLRNEKGQFASKGGVIEHKGYTCIYKPEHPRAKANGYVREHILVAEEMLGRPLDGEEVVHHINGDKADNRPENLEIFPTQAEHVRHHNRTDGKKYSYNGGEFTVAELSEFSVVDYSVLTQRINKLGWDIKRAVETPKRGQPTLGSLFDGIGGFPLAGALNGIEPIWASEVEPYPIAVTKSRFKEVDNG